MAPPPGYLRDMENPYQSPESPFEPAEDLAGSPFADHIPSGKASQVPLVAILMMVQGGFELLYAAFMFLMGVMMPMFMAPAMRARPGPPQGPPLAMMGWAMGGIYLGLGAVLLIGAVLKLAGGFRNYRYRGRVLGIVALISGLASGFSCYCFPTAIALLIYGLIVYFDQQTVYAFRLGAQGQTPEQIKATLDRFR